jgi:hypothetical protein
MMGDGEKNNLLYIMFVRIFLVHKRSHILNMHALSEVA